MRYFFLIYALVIVFVVSVFGCGGKFSQTPIEVFPDMDRQDYKGPQTDSNFFKNGVNSRKPIPNTNPMGHTQDTSVTSELNGYANKNTYLHTGMIDGSNFGKGLPTELDLKGNKPNLTALLARGKEMYGVRCAICHGDSGDGKGVVAKYFTGILPLNTTKLGEGAIYDVMVNGRGRMGQQAVDLTLYDRWAVIAYIKVLQQAMPKTTEVTPAAPAATKEERIARGKAKYKAICMVCHQENGAGLPNAFPPLAKSDYLNDKEKAISAVVFGLTGEITVNGNKFNSAMPDPGLNDEEVANVLTYVYSQWGNNGTEVTPEEVKAIRAKGQKK